MFVLRWLSNILAVLGFIMAAFLVYSATYPISSVDQKKISLNTIIGCDEKIAVSDAVSLSESELGTVQDLGPSVPVQAVSDFTDSINNLTRYMGTRPVIDVTYCNLSNQRMEEVQAYFADHNSDYSYGSVDEMVSKLNELPYLQISQINVQIPAFTARSTFCKTPIHKSEFYLFSEIPLGTGSTMVMFRISLEPDPEAPSEYTAAGNLVETGQFIKSQIYCNE
jgi:hypothetical protein